MVKFFSGLLLALVAVTYMVTRPSLTFYEQLVFLATYVVGMGLVNDYLLVNLRWPRKVAYPALVVVSAGLPWFAHWLMR